MSWNSLIVTDSIVEQRDHGSAILDMMTNLFRGQDAEQTLCCFVTISKVQRDIIFSEHRNHLNVLNPGNSLNVFTFFPLYFKALLHDHRIIKVVKEN